MSLTRQQKEEQVAAMQADLKDAISAVFVAYDKITVSEVEELRTALYGQGGRLRVMPKRLLKRVMDGMKLDFDPTAHDGQFAVIWGQDAVAPAKTLHEFAKGKDTIRLVAGSLDGELLTGDRVVALAKLPGKDQLIGQLVSVLAGPMRGFVSVINGVPRDFVYALQAIADEKTN